MKEPKKGLYNDVWFYYKKWLNNNGTDQEWENIIAEGDCIIEKYNNDPFARSLIGTIQIEISRKE